MVHRLAAHTLHHWHDALHGPQSGTLVLVPGLPSRRLVRSTRGFTMSHMITMQVITASTHEGIPASHPSWYARRSLYTPRRHRNANRHGWGCRSAGDGNRYGHLMRHERRQLGGEDGARWNAGWDDALENLPIHWRRHMHNLPRHDAGRYLNWHGLRGCHDSWRCS